MKDNEVKEKLESLSPLAGGVVFGKEEAWDKLQARLEKKPVRTFPLIRLSAAAILLLGIGGAVYNYLQQPATPENAELPAAAIATPSAAEQPSAATPLPQLTVSISPETVRIVHTINPVRKETPPVVEKSNVEPAPAPVTIVAPDPQPVVVSEPAKTNIPIHKMRVMHINDVGKPEEETAPVYVYNGPALDLSKMKVVSLNEIQREESMRRLEEDVITIVRINRPHGGFLGFTNNIGWGGTSQRTYAQNPLSIRLNRNN